MTIQEMTSYCWDDKAIQQSGKEQPLKVRDHSCVVWDTLIETDIGPVPIKELVGKYPNVVCYDENKHKATVEQATLVAMTDADAEIYELELEDATVIKLTGNHPVYTRRGWVLAQELLDSDEILKVDCFPFQRYDSPQNK